MRMKRKNGFYLAMVRIEHLVVVAVMILSAYGVGGDIMLVMC